MNPTDHAWLKAYPLLEKIADPAWERLLEQSQPVTLPPGTTVFRDGDSCSQYLLVSEGSIRVQKVAENGREIVLYRVSPGETCILTTACLLGADSYPAEGITETEVKAITVPAAAFNEAIATSPDFRRFVFAVYSQRVSDLIMLVEEVAFGRMDRRLAQCLIQRANTTGSLSATHQEIATELGTAREVISRLLKEFERRSWVKLSRGRIDITDLDNLTEAGQLGFM